MDWSNIYIVCYALAWLGLIHAQKKKVGKIGPATMVMISYFIFAVLAFFYYNTSVKIYSGNELTITPFLYLFFMLCLALAPGIYYERANVKTLRTVSILIVETFFVIYFVCSVVRLPYILPNMYVGITKILFDVQGGMDLYVDKQNSIMTASDTAISGFYGLVSIVHNVFRDVSVFLIFYYLTLKDKKKPFVVFISIIVIVDMLYSLSKGERNNVVLDLFMFAVGFFLFRDFMEKSMRKILKKIGIVTVVLFSIPLVAITISRFGDLQDTTTLNSTVAYAGQAPINFNLYVFETTDIRYGDRTMNLFKRLLGLDAVSNHEEAQTKYSNLKVDDRVFYTFVGDFVLDFGLFFSAFLFVITSLCSLMLIRLRGHTMALRQMLVVYFTLNVCAQGGMYLFSYAYDSNWRIIGIMFFYCVFAVNDSKTPMNAINYLRKV